MKSNPATGLKILLRLHDELQTELKYEIAREESQENQNGTENTNRETSRIDYLPVWPLAELNFQLFGMVTTHKMIPGTEAKPVFGCISLS